MKITYELFPFTDENLLNVLRNENITSENLKKRKHFEYFSEYLSEDGIGAKTIIEESPYVSKAYLKDFSNYYSTCFQNFERYCKRVHFFDQSFDSKKFEKELLNSSTFLNDCYLGYIVVKPLPDSIIGPTLLKTYSIKGDGSERYYPSCREYGVSLFGKELKINSLVYQEQDTVVAACASVAIWSAFHMTSHMFHTALPSPSEITQRAGNSFNNYGRTFPNPGLDIAQICKAIESTGLVSEFIISEHFKSSILLAKRLVYAYNRSGLPILLFLTFDDGSESGHLVTINGYSGASIERDVSESISLVADRIEKFYAHDDQVGPFAKMSFTGSEVIQTTWRNEDGTQITGKIYSVIIPVYRKIRIKFQDVFDKIRLIDIILFKTKIFRQEVEWDIYLIESNKYKNDVINNSKLDKETKHLVVTKSYPKYIWVGTALIGDYPLFDFVFDSTDIATGYFCIDFNLLFINKTFKEYLLDNFTLYKSIYVDERNGPRLEKNLYDSIIEQLKA